jgi:NADPH:quinone reductase-like Zn-dependent oxidoreductase
MAITYRLLGYHPRDSALQLHTKEFDSANLGANEILVRVAAAALNPVDLVLFNSRIFVYFSSELKGFGRDFAGVVDAVGSDVTALSKGDKISGIFEPIYGPQGSFSEYLIIDTKKNPNLGKIPKNLSLTQAAAFPLVFGTAFTTLTHFKKPADCDSVLVIGGATSVGSFTLQLLKKIHKVKTVVSINSDRSSESVKKYGADIIIDYTKGDVATQVSTLSKDIGKFDLIIDCVGSKDLFPVIQDVLKPKSENSGYVTIVGDKVLDYRQSFFKAFSFGMVKKFVFPLCYNYKMSGIAMGTWYEYAVGLIENGDVEIPIDSVVEGLDNYQDALNKLVDHKAQGKVILKIADLE